MNLLHAADLHLGTESYSKILPESGRTTRLEEGRRALGEIVRRALEWPADALLLAGDVFHGYLPSAAAQEILADALQPILARGIPIIVIPGNHDHPITATRRSPLAIYRALGIAGLVYAETPRVWVQSTPGGDLQIAALPWIPVLPGKSSVDRWYNVLNELRDMVVPNIPTVLLGHLPLAEARLSGSERQHAFQADWPSVSALLDFPADYYALGDVHAHQRLGFPGKPPVIYPGSLLRLDFSEMGDAKGFVEVTLGTEKRTWAFHEVWARPFTLIARLDLPVEADPTEVLIDAIKGKDFSESVVRLVYKHPENRPAHLPTLRKALEGAFFFAGLHRVPAEARPDQGEAGNAGRWGVLEGLERYLDQHPEWERHRPAVLDEARRLEQEVP